MMTTNDKICWDGPETRNLFCQQKKMLIDPDTYDRFNFGIGFLE